MKKIFWCYIIIFGMLPSCNSGSGSSASTASIDSSALTANDSVVEQSASSNTTSTPVDIPETHLHDTTIVSGSFILFLRPDSLRFESYTQEENNGIYEIDSDFGFGIAGTMDDLPKHKKYKNIQAFISENRYIIIKDCKTGPLTIDRDSINYGIILSGKGRKIKTTYESVHSGDYLGEINEYFNIR